MRAELWLGAKLGLAGRAIVFGGITDFAERTKRFRELIVASRLADRVAGRRKRKAVTYREAFGLVTGEPL